MSFSFLHVDILHFESLIPIKRDLTFGDYHPFMLLLNLMLIQRSSSSRASLVQEDTLKLERVITMSLFRVTMAFQQLKMLVRKDIKLLRIDHIRCNISIGAAFMQNELYLRLHV